MRNFSSPVDLTVFFFRGSDAVSLVFQFFFRGIRDKLLVDSVALDSDRRKNWVFALGWEAWM